MWAACFVLYDGALGSLFVQIGIYTAVLFVFCMVCNGELARSKPQPRFLTSFYLTLAAGGAVGGIFFALVAPRIFKGFWEYQMGLWMAAVLLLIILIRDKESWLYRSKLGSPVVVVAVAALLPESAALTITRSNKPSGHLSVLIALLLIGYVFLNRNRKGSQSAREKAAPVFCGVALLLAAIVLAGTAFAHVARALEVSRSFYGVLSAVPQNMDDPARAAFCMKHGRVVHGCQLRAEDGRETPTAYYGPASGVGMAILRLGAGGTSPIRQSLRIGAVGLGVGTIATYGKPGDTFRFYEINPDVIRMASDRRYFSFLSDSPAQIEVIPGDARLSLEHELEQVNPLNFDILIIDAFSGDAVPVHLLTLEAFGIYLRQIKKPSGVLAFQITNSYLDLKPVLFAAAKRLGLHAAWFHSQGDGRATTDNDWVLISTSDNLSRSNAATRGSASQTDPVRSIRPWTDDYSNLIQILNR